VVHKMSFMKETKGTLILTNKKLEFVGANQEIDFRQSAGYTQGRAKEVRKFDPHFRLPISLLKGLEASGFLRPKQRSQRAVGSFS